MMGLPLWANLIFLAVFIAHWTFVGYALIQLSRISHSDLPRQQRRLWIILILIGPALGAFLFLKFGRPSEQYQTDHHLYDGPTEETLDDLYGKNAR